jgi:hypothetical protein
MDTQNPGDALVDFAVMWEPFGGATAEEVFVEFGLDMSEYKRRLFIRLSKPDRAGSTDPTLRGRLIAYSLGTTK